MRGKAMPFWFSCGRRLVAVVVTGAAVLSISPRLLEARPARPPVRPAVPEATDEEEAEAADGAADEESPGYGGTGLFRGSRDPSPQAEDQAVDEGVEEPVAAPKPAPKPAPLEREPATVPRDPIEAEAFVNQSLASAGQAVAQGDFDRALEVISDAQAAARRTKKLVVVQRIMARQ